MSLVRGIVSDPEAGSSLHSTFTGSPLCLRHHARCWTNDMCPPETCHLESVSVAKYYTSSKEGELLILQGVGDENGQVIDGSRKRWHLDGSIQNMLNFYRKGWERTIRGCSMCGNGKWLKWFCREGTGSFWNKTGRAYWVQIVKELEYHAQELKLFFCKWWNRLN